MFKVLSFSFDKFQISSNPDQFQSNVNPGKNRLKLASQKKILADMKLAGTDPFTWRRDPYPYWWWIMVRFGIRFT